MSRTTDRGGHGRYPFRPITEPVDYRWPEGRGLAVYVAVNLEVYDFDAVYLDEIVPNPARPDLIRIWQQGDFKTTAARKLNIDIGRTATVQYLSGTAVPVRRIRVNANV